MISETLSFGLGWIHPVTVHLVTGAFFILYLTEAINYFTGKPEFFKVGSLLYLVLAGLTFLAAGSGLFSKSLVKITEADALSVFDAHQSLALISVILFALTGYSRLSFYSKFKHHKISLPTFLLLTVSLVFLVLTAWFGGKLVFHFGIGVHP